MLLTKLAASRNILWWQMHGNANIQNSSTRTNRTLECVGMLSKFRTSRSQIQVERALRKMCSINFTIIDHVISRYIKYNITNWKKWLTIRYNDVPLSFKSSSPGWTCYPSCSLCITKVEANDLIRWQWSSIQIFIVIYYIYLF